MVIRVYIVFIKQAGACRWRERVKMDRVNGTGVIIPTEHDKREWSRMAQDAYSKGFNSIGHRFSMASACVGIGQAVAWKWFDEIQSEYKSWLCFGFNPTGKAA